MPTTNTTDPWDNALFGNVSQSMYKTPPAAPAPTPIPTPETVPIKVSAQPASATPSTVVSPMLMKIGGTLVLALLFAGSFLIARGAAKALIAGGGLRGMASLQTAENGKVLPIVLTNTATSTSPRD